MPLSSPQTFSPPKNNIVLGAAGTVLTSTGPTTAPTFQPGTSIAVQGLVANSAAAATANTAAIAAAVALGGPIAIDTPGDIYYNATIVLISNTWLSIGSLTTLRMAPGAAQTMIVNSAYLAAGTVITSMTAAGTVVTVNTATTPTAGQWVAIHGSQTSGYPGVYLVQSVVAGVSFTYNAEILPVATPAVISPRYANMTWRLADVNINVIGGRLNYDFANNPGGTGLPSSCGIILAHIYNYALQDIQFHDIGTRCIYPFNARDGYISLANCDLTRVCIQTNGAIHGLTITDTDSTGTDDGIAIMARESSAFSNFTLSEGDVINVRVLRSNLDHIAPGHGIALYNFNQLFLMDDITVDGVAGNCGFGVYIAGSSGNLSSFGNIEIKNIKTSSSDRALWARFCSINTLRVCGFQPQLQTAGTNGLVIDTQTTIGLLAIDNYTWVPATTTDPGVSAVQFVTGGVPVKNFVIRGLTNNSGWVPSAAAFGVAFSTQPEIWEISDSYLNAGANAVLGFLNVAGNVGSFKNCRTVTARLSNGNGAAGSMTLLNIARCRVSGSTNSLSVTGAMTLNFDGYETDGGTNWLQVNGAVAVTIKGNGFNTAAMALALAGGPTLQIQSNEITADVGLLALTAGQFCRHASAVAGRNAAAQQGLAVSVLGTNWYALATGAAGVNTLIV